MRDSYSIRAGMAVVGEELELVRDACIHVRGGIIESISSASSCGRGFLGGGSILVAPQPALIHVHSGDHAFPEYGVDRSLSELVAPPDGLKHRRLAGISEGELVEAILEFYRLAWRLGVGLLADFREGGGVGCAAAKKAYSRAPDGLEVLVLGRPGPGFPAGCDGLGLSSPLDYEVDELKRLTSMLRPALTHVAETRETRLKGDLELALEAGFDAVIHGTFLSREDLHMLEEDGVGLVLCPRSNMWHGLGLPPVREAAGILSKLGLGSDNASWMPPDVWRELEVAVLIARVKGPAGEWLARRMLRAVFVDSYRMVGGEPRIVAEGGRASFLLFNVEGWGIDRAESAYYALVKRLGAGNLFARVDDGAVSFL